MKSTIRDAGDLASVVSVSGDLDIYAAPVLNRDLRALIARRRANIIVNLENVSYIDSTGIGVLMGALRPTRLFGGSILVVTRTERMKRLFEFLGLTTVLPIFDDETSAVSSLMSRAKSGRSLAAAVPN
jgi:anti-sigma B factor antagonist